MPLEDPTCIDAITRSDDGRVGLVIFDAGNTADPVARFQRLLEKIGTYVEFVLSDGFQDEHPGVKPGEVGIKVLCADPPTEEMLRFNRLENPEDASEAIGIEYEVFKGTLPSMDSSDDDGESSETPTPPTPGNPGSGISRWIFWFCMAGLFASGFYRQFYFGEPPWSAWILAFLIIVLRHVKTRQHRKSILKELEEIEALMGKK